MQAVFEDEPATGTKLRSGATPFLCEKFAIAEHTNRRTIRPNRSAESTVGGPQGRIVGAYTGELATRPIFRGRSMEFQTFHHQSRIRRQEATFLPARFFTQFDHRAEARGGPDGERSSPNADRLADKRPVAADFDRVAVAGGLHRLGQRV